jgi:PAS domain S-box-containing protein
VIDPPLNERPVLALEDVLDPLLCAVVVRDSSGRLLLANKAYEEILGFPPPEVVRSSNELPSLNMTDVEGKPLRPTDWPAATVLAGRSVSDLTLSLIRPDGRKVWLRVDAARIEKPQFGTLTVSTFIDVTHRQEAEETARVESARATQLLTVLQRLHQQQAGIAELGRLALVGMAPPELMDHAVALVDSTLKPDYVRILELLPDGNNLLLRAGTGWRPGLVGTAIVSGENTQAGYLIETNEDMVIEDFRTEKRFVRSQLLREHRVRSGIRAVIRGKNTPFGDLAAYTKQIRHFAEEDIIFMRAVANTLADAFIGHQADREQEQTLRSLEEVNEARQRLVQRLSNIVEEERRRIANDIHDSSLQVLAGLGIRLQLVAEKVDDPDQRKSLSEMSPALAEAGHRLRRLIFDLRPDTLELGLEPALRFYFEQTSTGVDPELVIDSRLSEEPPEETRLMVYRACQEALNNVRKHARASRVTISLEEVDDGIGVLIHDDGVGFDVSTASQPGHIGLVAMRERIQIAGGRFSISSMPGQGTTAQFWVPLRHAE